MRINESFSAPISTGRADGTQTTTPNGSTTSRSAESSEDLVSLSNAANLISRTMTSGSSERAAHIQSISARIQAGTYSVSAETLSGSMLGAMLQGD